MIKRIEVTEQFINAHKEFLKELQDCISAGIRVQILITDNIPDVVLRTRAIIDAIKDKFEDAVTTLVSPGAVIQMLFPSKEMLIAILFSTNPMTNEKQVHLEICRLSTESFAIGN